MELKICKCGLCNKEFKGISDYIKNHEKQEIILCGCDCGQQMLKYNNFGHEKKFINHHFFAKLNKGKDFSEETRQKMKEAKIGYKPWNTGLTKETNEAVKKLAENYVGFKHSDETKKLMSEKKIEFIKENGNSFLGKKHSEETKEKMRQHIRTEEHCKHISENKKGKSFEERHGEKVEEVRKILSIGTHNYLKNRCDEIVLHYRVMQEGEGNSFYGKHHTEEYKQMISNQNKGTWVDKYGEHKADIMQAKHSASLYHFYESQGYIPRGLYKNFGPRFKKLIKIRDEHKCQLCNEIKKLCIHHIFYDKKDSRMETCISLCRPCHTKTNVNREYYIKYFMELLKIKHKYEPVVFTKQSNINKFIPENIFADFFKISIGE